MYSVSSLKGLTWKFYLEIFTFKQKCLSNYAVRFSGHCLAFVYIVLIARVITVRTCPRAMPLAVITMRKSIHGFPFLFYICMGTSEPPELRYYTLATGIWVMPGPGPMKTVASHAASYLGYHVYLYLPHIATIDSWKNFDTGVSYLTMGKSLLKV